jgi:hypothetical protein
MATLVRYLSDETHRLRMIGLLDDPAEDVVTPLVQGIGHMEPSPMSDQVLRSTLGTDLTALSRAKLYALGMSGSPGLAAIAASEQAPEWQRVAARWWVEHGPAVRR